MNITEIHFRDWKHLWLHSTGWDAFAVWSAARWDPLDPEERLAFVLSVTGGKVEHSIAFDEYGDLVDDCLLAGDAYLCDPEVPSHMVEPVAHIQGESFFKDK